MTTPKRLLTAWVLLLTGLCVAAPFFTDDFESGDLSKTENNFAWTGARPVKISPNGTYAIQFNYGPDGLNDDSWQEQRFNFGNNYGDIWIKYDLYVPDNWYHRCPVKLAIANQVGPFAVGDTVYETNDAWEITDQNNWGIVYHTEADTIWVDRLSDYYMFLDGDYLTDLRSGARATVAKRLGYGNNNKFILLWQGQYGSAYSGTFVDFEYWSKNHGNSRLSCYMGNDSSEWNAGHVSMSNTKLILDQSTDLGQWMELIFHVKIASVANNDGIIHIFKNGQEFTYFNDITSYSDKGYNHFEYGYLLGWSNSGYKDLTTMYIDNIVLSEDSIASTYVGPGIHIPVRAVPGNRQKHSPGSSIRFFDVLGKRVDWEAPSPNPSMGIRFTIPAKRAASPESKPKKLLFE